MSTARRRSDRALTLAKGNALQNGARRQLSISFETDLFYRIRRRALRDGTSFSELVRTFCEWGLDEGENDDDDD